MARKKLKFLAGQYISESMSIWCRTDGGGVLYKIALAEIASDVGYYFYRYDGSADDLVKLLEDRVNAAIAPDGESITVVSNTGKIIITSSDDTEIYFNDPDLSPPELDADHSMEVFDALFSLLNPDTNAPQGVLVETIYSATRMASIVYLPERYMFVDLPSYKIEAGQSRSVSGKVRTVVYGAHVAHKFSVILENAFPRSLLDNEWKNFTNLMKRLSKGVPFELYPDRENVTAAFDEYSEPFGYSVLTLSAESFGWTPDGPYQGRNYKQFDAELKCFAYTE